MKVKWNRSLDGNTPGSPGHSPSDEIRRNSPHQTMMKEPISTPVTTVNRPRKKCGQNACDLLFGPRRISPGALRAPPFGRRSSLSDDKKSLTKLSSFLGLFRLNSDMNRGKSDDIPSIRVIRRHGPDSQSCLEPETMFQTDSKRRRRANHLLQRNSAIRRSWNQMNMQNGNGGGGGGSLGRSWLASSPLGYPYHGRFRATSPSGTGSTRSGKMSEDIYGDGLSYGGHKMSGSETPQFGNSCRVNSMPAPIVTLSECILDLDEEEEEDRGMKKNLNNGKIDREKREDKLNKSANSSLEGGYDELDDRARSPPKGFRSPVQNRDGKPSDANESPLNTPDQLPDNDRALNKRKSDARSSPSSSNEMDKSDLDESIVIQNGFDKPNLITTSSTTTTTTKTSESYQENEDVFIQVRITSSLTPPSSPRRSPNNMTTIRNSSPLRSSPVSLAPSTPLSDLSLETKSPSPVVPSTRDECSSQVSECKMDTFQRTSPTGDKILSSETTVTTSTKKLCPSKDNGSPSRNTSQPSGSPASTQTTIRKELTTTATITKTSAPLTSAPPPPSKTDPKQSMSTSVDSRVISRSPTRFSDRSVTIANTSDESHDHDQLQPPPGFESTSAQSGVHRNGDFNYSSTSSVHRSRPRPIAGPPVDLYQQQKQQSMLPPSSSPADEAFLCTEPQKSEVIRVTVRKAQMPELVHLKSDNILDIVDNNNGSLLAGKSQDENSEIMIHYRNGSKHGGHQQRLVGHKGRENSPSGSGSFMRNSVRQGILKDSNCINGNGFSYRNSLPKKVHFAESTEVTSHSRFNDGTSVRESSTSSSMITSFPSIGEPVTSHCGSSEETSISSTSSAISNDGSDGTTFTASSSLTIKKTPSSSSSARKHHNMLPSTNPNDHQPQRTLSKFTQSNDQPPIQSQTATSDGCHVDNASSVTSGNSPSGIQTVSTADTMVTTINPLTRTNVQRKINFMMHSSGVKSPSDDRKSSSPFDHTSGQTRSSADLLEHHRRMSQLHQRKLEISREELSKSILIIQGLSVVIKHLTEQYDAFSTPNLKEKLDLISDKFERSDHQFRCQEEALNQLKSKYVQSECELREEVRKLQNDLAHTNQRHENEKKNLIASFELELDAARKRFEDDMIKMEGVKNDLKKLNNQLREQLKLRDNQIQRDQIRSRDLTEAQRNIAHLRSQLEILQASKDQQTKATQSLKLENRNLKEELRRGHNELSKIAMKKEELEYMLYNTIDSNYESATIFNTSTPIPDDYQTNRTMSHESHYSQVRGQQNGNRLGNFNGDPRKWNPLRPGQGLRSSTMMNSISPSPISASTTHSISFGDSDSDHREEVLSV
ncbi:uncharacterized protein LOC141856798 [Brevipalpus obovatus]|uniref:uncharacterized protein LOC141856798 n=1 Tax=Brevipalpus obovatus TaxID=246614 RepID=UPI003D9E234B